MAKCALLLVGNGSSPVKSFRLGVFVVQEAKGQLLHESFVASECRFSGVTFSPMVPLKTFHVSIVLVEKDVT